MTDTAADEFFTQKHKKLLTIATIANVAAWVIMIVQILLIGARFIEAQNAFLISNIDFYNRPDFWTMITKYPLYKVGFFVNLASIFIMGVVYWLVLKGISLGLNMIVETDMNYRERIQKADHE